MANTINLKSEYLIPIATLALELVKKDIPFTCDKSYDGLQLRFPWCDGDIICHSGSYGHEVGHIESYCFPWDDGNCTELAVHEAVYLLTDLYSKVEA